MGLPCSITDLSFEIGNPLDWSATMPVPHRGPKAAIVESEESSVTDHHILLRSTTFLPRNKRALLRIRR